MKGEFSLWWQLTYRELRLWHRDRRLWMPLVITAWSMMAALGYGTWDDPRALRAVASHAWMLGGIFVIPWLWSDAPGVREYLQAAGVSARLLFGSKIAVMGVAGGILPLVLVVWMALWVSPEGWQSWAWYGMVWAWYLPWWGMMGAIFGRLLHGLPFASLWIWVGILPMTLPVLALFLPVSEGSLPWMAWAGWWMGLTALGGYFPVSTPSKEDDRDPGAACGGSY